MSKKGPFGLWMGMTKSDFDQPLTELAPGKFHITTVPNPHSAFDNYILQISPSSGLSLVKALGKSVITSPYGIELKSTFEIMEKKLSNIYGKQKKFDFLMHESIWSEPRDWMQSVLSKERFLTSEWSKETGASIGDYYSSISLSIGIENTSTGYMVIEYAFKNFATAEAEIAAMEDDVL